MEPHCLGSVGEMRGFDSGISRLKPGALLLLLLLLTACGGSRPPLGGAPLPPAGGVGAALSSVGWWLIWAGTFAGVAGTVARGFLAWGGGAILARVPFIGAAVRVCAVAGFGLVGLGCAYIWLGERPWILGAAGALLGLGLALGHSRAVRRRLGRWLGGIFSRSRPRIA